VRVDCSSCNEGWLLDSLSRGWRQHVGARMNGSDDEQHDAHVKCYRIAVAVADGDAVAATYDKHLAKSGSTDEDDAAYRAYVERVSSAWIYAPLTSPPELLLAPGRILARHQPDQGRAIASRPKHRSDPPPSARSRSPPEPRCRGWSQPTSSPRSSGVGIRFRPGVIGETQMTKAQPEHLLPRNERIRKAAKIVDENRSRKVGGCTDSIANMLA
jgi:hypothetical protein